MATTIRDVVRAASVSIGTVSRALKNQPGLSEATRERVAEVAQQLDYDSAQLRTRIRCVTFLLHRQHNNFSVSPFFSHVLNGFEEACCERKLVPSVLTAGPTHNLAQQMRLHAPDAIAVVGFVEPELLSHLHSLARPIVLIDLRAPGFRSVNIDNVKSVSLAMQHLFAQGRRRVAFIGGSLAHHSIAQRALGYRKAYFDAGLLFDPTLEIVKQAARPARRSRRRRRDGTPDRRCARNPVRCRTPFSPIMMLCYGPRRDACLPRARAARAGGHRLRRLRRHSRRIAKHASLSTVTVDKEVSARAARRRIAARRFAESRRSGRHAGGRQLHSSREFPAPGSLSQT